MRDPSVEIIDDQVSSAHLIKRSVSHKFVVDFLPRLKLCNQRVADLRLERDVVEAESAELVSVLVDEGATTGRHDMRLENIGGSVDSSTRSKA